MCEYRKNRLFNPFNYNAIILDEIALEGLDGITWEGLLKRLEVRKPSFLGSGSICSKAESFIWSVVKELWFKCDIQVFRLKNPRKELVIFDRYQHVDPDLGIIIEPERVPDEIYPFKAIDGEEKGSCSEYETRKRISPTAVQKLNRESFTEKNGGDKGFVLVASQRNRAKALLNEDYDEVSFPLSSLQWCILERIGRARHHGEVSQGKLSLQFMNDNPKTLFYHRKALISFGLITKQIHHQKSHGQNFQGTLFHLPRFYTERKSKALMLVHSMVSFLKTKRNGMVSCEEMREHLKLGHIKKIYKSQEFLKFMKGSFVVPFRTLYPLSKNWRCKNSLNKEKNVRVIQLLDMDVDPDSIWHDKKDEDEDEEEGSFFKDQSSVLFDRSLMYQAYELMEKMGPEGIYQCELGRRLGLGKLESRTVCRNLERRGLVKTIIKDSGRQRITYFIASKYSHLSKESKKLKLEKEKLASYTQSPKADSSEKVPSPTEQPQSLNESFNLELKEKSMPIDTQVFDSPVLLATSTKGLNQTENNSFRQLSRANVVMESVQELKVIDDITKLHKIIILKEEAEGVKSRMDKKSLLRILGKLADDKQIRNIKVVLQNQYKKRVLHFVCDPSIDESNSVIQSAIEQAKMKFSITPKANDEFTFRSNDVESSNSSTSLKGKLIYNPRIGKTYGLQPKFIRMREFHVFLFYLTYGYDGELIQDKEDLYREWEDNHEFVIDDEIREELKDISIYSRTIGWSMFMPQLPKHRGWASGWCLMSDVLLRLPLSYFVKLVNVTYFIKGIEEYLSHPVRQHYLIQFLPQEMRKKLLFHRKYIFSCYEIATRLAYIGVFQFGPHKLKEKDQFFLYVNKNALLLDTTNSTPGYHKIDPTKDYPRKRFVFNSLDDVEQYWYRMWEICIYTPLGITSTSLGQEITLEVVDKKEELIACLNPKECDEAISNDVGYLPGDQCGGAGLDSSMFSHLKRSWSWTSHCDTKQKSARSSGSRIKSIKLSMMMPDAKNASRNLKRKRKAPSSATPTTSTSTTTTGGSKSSVRTRIIAKRTKKEERKPYYDDVDKAALRLMRKLRVDWTNAEDSLLLLCKVAGSYLCQNSRYQMVQYTAVRDLLHKRFPESLNKTSRACQRRLNYMMKNSTTADNVSLFLSDVLQDSTISRMFPISDYDKSEDEQRLKTNFEPLVSMLVTKYQSIEYPDANNPSTSNMIPGTMEELVSNYKFVYPQTKNGELHFEEPKTTDDIKALMINSLITSSLCSASDKNSWAFQLYKIYQQYPDWMLRNVMNKLRSDKMVSLKKQCNRSRMKTGNYLPLSSSPYQLSVTFSHIFLNRYQHEIYHQSWEFVKNIVESRHSNPNDFMEVILTHEGGYTASIACLLALKALRFQIEVPDQLVVMDPNMSGNDDAYARILRRYKELLRNSGSKEIETDLDSPSFNLRSPAKEKPKEPSAPPRPPSHPSKNVLTKCVTLTNSEIIFKESVSTEPSNASASTEERSSQLVARSASRIALHVMKEESKDLSKSSDDEINKNNGAIQHSHDFFVISSCRIFVNYLGLDKPNTPKPFKFVNSKKGNYVEVPRSLLPADIDAYEGILNRHGLDVYGKFNLGVSKLRKTCVPGDKTFYKDIPPKSLTAKVYNFIKCAGELGVSGTELTNQFPDFDLVAVCTSMIDSFLILRTGCIQTRYICVEFGSPWLLHSFKMLRTKHREAAPTIKTTKKLFKVQTDGENSSKSEISEAVKKVDWSKVDQIHVLLRPWIKIDGNLNRRVLDRLLGAVLGHVMLKPGMFMDKIQQKFSPALQPQHTRELLEMLDEMGAITISKLPKSLNCSLFSSIEIIEKSDCSILDEAETLIVEPVVDAIIKLGHFIGDRQYSQDFVCQCPCHPDKK